MVDGSATLFGKLEVRNSDSANLLSRTIIKNASSRDLRCLFFTRLPRRLWTNRRYLNGVVDIKEIDMGDAVLEYVIEGVMEDIQGILGANGISYSDWTDITLVPVLIKRATTYGTVASLYARKSKSFRSRVIPSVAPVTITVLGDDALAMKHWDDRCSKALDLYLTTIGTARVLVSTQDQEPVFNTDLTDPWEAGDELSWHEWQLRNNQQED